ALRNPSVDRVVKVSARHVHVLPDVDEYDGVPGVLAIRILALGGEILVLDQQVEDLAPDRGLLAFASALHELDHLGRHDVADLHAQLADDLRDTVGLDLPDGPHAVILRGRFQTAPPDERLPELWSPPPPSPNRSASPASHARPSARC